MRVGIDGTPLLGKLTGVGTYTANLVNELAPLLTAGGDELVATAFSRPTATSLRSRVPAEVQVAVRQIPARVLHGLWRRFDVPPVQMLCGPVDVFHATNFVLPPTGRAAGVVTVHDLAYLRFPSTVQSASLTNQILVPRAIRRGAWVITPTEAVADQVRSAYRIDPERVRATLEGVDPAWFGPHRHSVAGLPSEYLLAVGTIEPRKNLGVVLDVLRRAKQTGRRLPPLVLVGGAGWGSALDLRGLTTDDVVDAGYLTIEDLRGVVAGASALVFPSLDEGFGLPPLEALACGVPVAAADIPVCREVLGDQAVFAPPRDTEAFAAAIETALAAPPGDRDSRRDHASQFTWARTARATVDVYRDAVASG